jgi:hypothetical protein
MTRFNLQEKVYTSPSQSRLNDAGCDLCGMKSSSNLDHEFTQKKYQYTKAINKMINYFHSRIKPVFFLPVDKRGMVETTPRRVLQETDH